MRERIKLICTDIDGTLLNEARWLSERTIIAFAKANLPIILASSRPPQAMRYLQQGLGIESESLIAFNGGLIINKNGNVLEDNSFSSKILKTLLDHHSKHTYNLSIYSHEHWFTCKNDSYTKHEIFTTRDTPIIQPARNTLDFLETHKLGIHKLMCMGTSVELDSLVQYLQPLYGQTIHLYRSKDTYLEITLKNIDKAKALQKLLAAEYTFGMEAIMSFGDNHNDEELLRLSGYGVAVANATESVKCISDFVSEFTNKEDAIARVLEQHIPY